MTSRKIEFNPRETAVCGFLLLAVALVFGQTVQHEFINFDDGEYIYANPNVSHGLTASGVAWAFTQSYQSNWIPLTWISLMIDWSLYDVHAGGYHLTNVLLHAATAILLFLMLHRVTDRFWPSAFVAALFAVHPLQVESVAWVTARKDVLSGLFFMLTLLAYVDYTRRRFSIARYALVIVLLALGLMAKSMLVTLPFVLLLLDYWPLGRLAIASRTWPRLVIEKIPLLIVAGGDCLITLLVQNNSLVPNERLGLYWRFGNAMISYVVYLGKFFYPVGLAVVYPRLEPNLPLWQVFGAVLILACITTAVFIGRRRCPYLLVGWLWYLGMLVPVIGFLQVGEVSVADRFTYLPQIGLSIGLAWGVADLCRSRSCLRGACGVGSLLALAVLMGCAFRQTSYWRDSETLWTHAIECTSGNVVAHTNLGVVLAEEGRGDEAMDHFQRAVKILPNSAVTLYNLGSRSMLLGRLDEAKNYYWKALQIDPSYTAAYGRLGLLMAGRGQFDEAIALFQKSLEINANNPETCYDLGKALMARGRRDEAGKIIRIAAELAPDYAVVHNELGLVMAGRGRLIEGIELFQRAVDADPAYVEARINLARLLSETGRPSDASAQYRAVLKTDPNNAEARDSLVRLGTPH
jgi:tetratricopeptide (TPR) repeat protein